MNIGGLPIGNIRDASEIQFALFYRQVEPDSFTESGFIEEYMSKKSQADKDFETLKELGVTPEQIGEKLWRIIEKAGHAYKLTFKNERIYVLSQKFKRPITVMVEDDDAAFYVSGFENRQEFDGCSLCHYRKTTPATYKIENSRTLKSFTISEVTLHLILAHGYFARPGLYRLDPSRVCKVLCL